MSGQPVNKNMAINVSANGIAKGTGIVQLEEELGDFSYGVHNRTEG